MFKVNNGLEPSEIYSKLIIKTPTQNIDKNV